MSVTKTRQASRSSRSSFGGASCGRRDSRLSTSNDEVDRNQIRKSILANNPVFGPESPIEEISDYVQSLNKAEINQHDIFGRTLLHLAASLDDLQLLNAILENPHVDLNAVDSESHWNALHRALANGNIDCAQLLLDRNWSYIKTKDRDEKTPFDIINSTLSSFSSKVSLPWSKSRGGSEAFLFGSNTNNNLGFADFDDRSRPELIRFDKALLYPEEAEIAPMKFMPLRVSEMKLSKYHSVVCLGCKSRNNLLVCGISRGGRLGLGKTNSATQFKFTPVSALKHTRVMSVDLGVEHTVAITFDGECYTWGNNKYGQLGYITSPEEVIQSLPRKVTGILRRRSMPLVGCAASNVHTVVYTRHVAYTWGRNVGQMGVPAPSDSAAVESSPRHLAEFESGISEVACGDNITAILDQKGHVHIYASGKRYSVFLPQAAIDDEFDLYRPCLKEETVVSIKCTNGGWLGLRSDLGNLYRIQLNRAIDYNNAKKTSFVSALVWKVRSENRKAVDFDIGDKGFFIVACEAGVWRMRPNKGGNWNDARFKFDRVPLVNKISQVRCDDQFKSFATIRDELFLRPIKVDQENLASDFHYLVPFTSHIEERKRIGTLDVNVSSDSESFKSFSVKVPHMGDKSFENRFNTRFAIEEGSSSDSDLDLESYSDDSEFETHDLPIANGEHPKKWDELEDLKRFLSQSSEENLGYLVNSFSCQTPSVKSDGFFNFLVEKPEKDDQGHDQGHYVIPVLKHFLSARTKILSENSDISSKKAFSITDGKYSLNYDSGLCSFTLRGFKVLSVMVFIYEMYTGIALPVWHSVKKADSKNANNDYLIRSQLMVLYDMFKFAGNSFTASMTTSVSSTSLGRDMAAIRNRPESFPDVQFLLKDGKKYLAHSSVLKSRSAYFDVCLSERWSISRETNRTGFTELNFDTIDIEIFDLAMLHIYSDATVTLFSEVNAGDYKEFINFVFSVMDLAEVLMLNRLLQVCEATLLEFVNIKNVGSILDEAFGYSVGQLKSRLLFYICHNIESIMENRFLTGISQDSLRQINQAMHKYIHRDEKADERMRNSILQFLNDPHLHDELMAAVVPVAGGDNNVSFLARGSTNTRESDKEKEEERAEPDSDRADAVFNLEMDVSATSPPTSANLTPLSTSTPIISRSASYRNSPMSSGSSSLMEPTKISITPNGTADSPFRPVRSSQTKHTALKDARIPSASIAITPRSHGSPQIGGSGSPSAWGTSLAGSPRSIPNIVRADDSSKKVTTTSGSSWSSNVVSPSSVRPATYTLDTVTMIERTSVKESQKERKQKQKQRAQKSFQLETATSSVCSSPAPRVNDANPWNIPKRTFTPSAEIFEKKSFSDANRSSTISSIDLENIPLPLSEIMKEDQMKAAKRQVKSFEEIQEEEAFQKWWDEESKRVQRELSELDQHNTHNTHARKTKFVKQRRRQHQQQQQQQQQSA